MKYIIDKELFEKYPDLRVGVVIGKGLNIAPANEDLNLLKAENTQKFLNFMEGKELSEQPNINAWREIYKSLGIKPKRYPPTAEALLKRIIKGDPLPTISTAVDAYLAVELLYLLPIGGYDLSNISGDIVLRVSEGGEPFYSIGSDKEELTEKGEVIYADDKSVLTRRWNYRDADHSKITTDSKDIILLSEAAVNTIKTEDIKGTVDKMIEYESKFCGGEYKSFFLDINTQSAEF